MSCFTLPDGVLDLDARAVRRTGATHRLTRVEHQLLAALAARPGEVVPRGELLAALGYAPQVKTRALDHAVTRLRRKLEVDPGEPTVLVTVYGVGFALHTPEAAPRAAVDVRFVGRAAAAAELAELASTSGLVTVVGPGGVGKTRLSTRWAESVGAPVVSLRAARTADDVLRAVAEALDVPLGGGEGALVGRLERALRGGAVVLDNLEQIEPNHRSPVSRLAGVARVVGTSRRALKVPGERVLSLGPLDPAAGALLFRARATAARGGRPLEPEDLERVESIVSALGGLPLAIELAAARAALLPVADVARRVVRGDDLGSGGRSGPGRTMEQTLQASWDLLDRDGRAALAAMSVFPESFPVAAWEAVCPTPDPIDRLEELVEHSLATVDPVPGRVALLEPVRRFAASRLAASPGRSSVRAAMAAYAAQLCDRHAEPALVRGERETLVSERALLDAALDAALEDGHAGHAARILLGLDVLLRTDGPADRRRERLEQGVAAARSLEGDAASRIGWRLADALRRLGRVDDALGALDAAEACAGSPEARAEIVAARGTIELSRGDLDAAERCFDAAIAGFAEGPRFREGLARFNRANVDLVRGRVDAADAGFRAAVEVLEQARADAFLPAAWAGLAMACVESGELDEAKLLLRRARARRGSIPELHRLHFQRHFGVVALRRGELDEAEAELREVVTGARALGEPSLLADALDGLGRVLLRGERGEDAHPILEEARAAHRELGRAAFAASIDALLGVDEVLRGLGRSGAARLQRAAAAAQQVGGAVYADVAGLRALASAALGEEVHWDAVRGDRPVGWWCSRAAEGGGPEGSPTSQGGPDQASLEAVLAARLVARIRTRRAH